MAHSIAALEMALQEATALASTARNELNEDNHARLRIASACRAPFQSIQTPSENIYEILYGPHLPSVARTAVDADWLKLVAENSNGVAPTKVAEQTRSEPEITARFLRSLAAAGMMHEVDVQTYMPNDTTRAAASEGLSAGIQHAAWEHAPTLANMPAYF